MAVALAAVALGCGGGGDVPAGELVIEAARVEPSPTGRGPAGGFLTLTNETDRPVVLVGASSPAAARIELHRSWIEGGVARMAPVTELAVPPGEQVRLEPGGLHLMLFDATGIAPGGEIVLRLAFAGGESREVTARVADAGGGGADPHAGHGADAHSGHDADPHAGHESH